VGGFGEGVRVLGRGPPPPRGPPTPPGVGWVCGGGVGGGRVRGQRRGPRSASGAFPALGVIWPAHRLLGRDGILPLTQPRFGALRGT